MKLIIMMLTCSQVCSRRYYYNTMMRISAIINIFLLPSRTGLFHCHLFVSPNHKFGPPEFPNMISTQRTCYWRLIGLQNIRNYQLRILYFDLPMSTNCSNSSLKVYNGFSTAIHVEPLATLCGYLAPDRRVVKGRGQAMTAMLTVNTQENNFRGFHAVFEEIPIEDVHLNP